MTKDLKRLAEAWVEARAHAAILNASEYPLATLNRAYNEERDAKAAFLQALEAPAVTEDAKAEAREIIYRHMPAARLPHPYYESIIRDFATALSAKQAEIDRLIAWKERAEIEICNLKDVAFLAEQRAASAVAAEREAAIKRAEAAYDKVGLSMLAEAKAAIRSRPDSAPDGMVLVATDDESLAKIGRAARHAISMWDNGNGLNAFGVPLTVYIGKAVIAAARPAAVSEEKQP